MERSTPVRKPYSSTADLLTWSDSPTPALTSRRMGSEKWFFVAQVTDDEFESLNKRKPFSGYKMKEVTGSGIFAFNGENDESEQGSANPTSNSKTGLRMYQEGSISPKKPTTLPEVAKQRELSGTLETEDAKFKKQLSEAKCKDLNGHDIFAPSPEILPRQKPVRALELKHNFDMGEPDTHNPAGSSMSSEEAAIKTAKKIHNQKFAGLSGNGIFKGDVPPCSGEKPLSAAKLWEMRGSYIFADGKAESRE